MSPAVHLRQPEMVTRLSDAPVPPGYTAWRVGGDDGPVTALPTLLESAPFDVRARYLARVRATALGRCPLCDAVAGATTPDPTRHRASFYGLPLTVPLPIEHATGPGGEPCPAVFTDDDRHYFDPRAVGDPPTTTTTTTTDREPS